MAGIKRIREKEVTQGSKGEDCMMESSRDQDTVCLYPITPSCLTGLISRTGSSFRSLVIQSRYARREVSSFLSRPLAQGHSIFSSAWFRFRIWNGGHLSSVNSSKLKLFTRTYFKYGKMGSWLFWVAVNNERDWLPCKYCTIEPFIIESMMWTFVTTTILE